MKYYYQLSNNRITCFTKTTPINLDEFFEIELEEEPSEIILGAQSIVDGKLVFLGYSEKDQKIINLNEKLSRKDYLKQQLNLTDYRVIKCYEAQLLQEEMPYDLQTLLAQRKAWRDEINQLEFEISMLG
jgi:hypothetical protein